MSDGRGKKTTECSSELRAAVKERESLLGFTSLVPVPEQIEAPRERAGLNHPEEETCRKKSTVASHKPLAHRNDTEEEGAGWDYTAVSRSDRVTDVVFSRQIEGRICLNAIVNGTSKMAYATKSMTRAVLN